jgi:hypothetical protein
VAKDDQSPRDAPPGRAGVDPRSIPNPKAQAAVERLKDQLDQKAGQRSEEEQAVIDQARRAVRDPDPDEMDPGVAEDLETAGESRSIRDQKGLFVGGNPGGPGRPRGSKNVLPRGSRKTMKELIAGRIKQDGQPIRIIVDLFFEGLQGKMVLRRN